MRNLLRRRSKTQRRERGAVLIEATIVLPLLLLMVFGIAEFGFLFKDNITLKTTTRSGARVASNLANTRGTDFETIRTITAAVSGGDAIGLDNIEGILIYNATVNLDVPSGCINASGGGQSSSLLGTECNFYSASQVALIANDPSEAIKHFGGENPPETDNECIVQIESKAIWDASFCPSKRARTPNPQTEYVGVWVQVNHQFITGVLPQSEVTFSDKTTMGIEPVGAL